MLQLTLWYIYTGLIVAVCFSGCKDKYDRESIVEELTLLGTLWPLTLWIMLNEED